MCCARQRSGGSWVQPLVVEEGLLSPAESLRGCKGSQEVAKLRISLKGVLKWARGKLVGCQFDWAAVRHAHLLRSPQLKTSLQLPARGEGWPQAVAERKRLGVSAPFRVGGCPLGPRGILGSLLSTVSVPPVPIFGHVLDTSYSMSEGMEPQFVTTQ